MVKDIGDVVDEAIGPSEKARIVAADINLLKKECKLSKKMALKAAELVHMPLAVGSESEENPSRWIPTSKKN